MHVSAGHCLSFEDAEIQLFPTCGVYTHDACSHGSVQFLTQLKAERSVLFLWHPVFHWPRQRAQHKLLGTPTVPSCPRPSISGSFESFSEACCICSLFFSSRLWVI